MHKKTADEKSSAVFFIFLFFHPKLDIDCNLIF